jgi:hypothetical protein
MPTLAVPDSSASSSKRFPFLRIFLLFASVYTLTFWPALCVPWWQADDYALGGAFSWSAYLDCALWLGRPLDIVWLWSLRLDCSPSAAAANMALRAAQVGVHVLAATLIAYALWRRLRAPILSSLAVLPFLLWFFNPDAVLLRTAGPYPQGCLLSVAGMLLIQVEGVRRTWLARLAGVCCLAASVLSNQSSAMAGPVVWMVVLALTVLQEDRIAGRKLFREGSLLFVGLLLGMIGTMVCVRCSSCPINPRAKLATDLGEKVRYLAVLNDIFLLGHRHLYPRLLQYAHASLCGVVAVLLLRRCLRRTAEGWQVNRAAVFASACLAANLVLPYAAVMLSSESCPHSRVIYLAPLFLTGCLAVGFLLLPRALVPRLALTALLLVILGAYHHRAWIHAEEYSLLEQRDRETLARLESFAREHQTSRVVVLTEETLWRNRNPYQLQMTGLGNHSSSFTFAYSAVPFVHRYSSLTAVVDPVLERRALEQVEASPREPGFQFSMLQGTDVVIVTPP